MFLALAFGEGRGSQEVEGDIQQAWGDWLHVRRLLVVTG